MALSDQRIRELYATADHYDKTHARRDLNEAEFNEWLVAHDAELTFQAVASLVHVLKTVPDGMFWNRDRASTTAVKDHVTLMLNNAEALGANVDKSILEGW